ncbi:MAG TPA: HD domain-containing phosphohydrolase [Burkholderiaceae bacterium]|jgi:HD-GYP domain-containing protein (c-di-GMP phosphodiesterase class II)|nr:HD domain-containing phosphohydrolase [Burkholderiaceae bacterium]
MDGSSAPPPIETDHDAQYLKAIASCGDKRPLVVSQAIYSATGIKLLDTGAKVDSRILDRLFGHKLADPIDRSVASEDAVRPKDLVARARELIAAAPLLAHFEASLPAQSSRVWSAIAAGPLPPAIAMRLTVVRETVPHLYDHLLQATFIALFIGTRARFSDRDLQVLASAALLHDIGMMHADPSLYDTEKPLDVAGRRNLYAHPVTGQMIAQREPSLSPAVATAIVQHHERLDGTGYPRGLSGEAIGKFGRVLMLVEIVLAMLEHQPEHPELGLSLVLRLNRRSFDAGLSAIVLAALPRIALGEGETAGSSLEYQQVSELIDTWPKLCGSMPPAAGDRAAEFIEARLVRLRRELAEGGFGNPEAAALAADGDPMLCVEMAGLAREALWHARQIAYDALQRWPQLAPGAEGASPASAPGGSTAGKAGAAAEWVAMGLKLQATT